MQGLVHYINICSVKVSFQKTPKWRIFLALIVVGVLLIALWKGCQNANKANAAKDARIDSLTSRLKYNDSIGKLNQREYEGVMEYANGIISLRNNQLAASQDSNDKLNDKIASLLKKHKPITPAVDTSVTTVPNEYLEECTTCMDLLDKSRQLARTLRADQDNLTTALKSQISIHENRVKQLGLEVKGLNSVLDNCIETAQKIKDENRPRRRMFLSLGLIGSNDVILNGVGAGLIYMDKKSRLYGGTYFGTNLGPMFTAQMSFPLSLKRK
jgi:hypothetical protein